MLEKTISDHKQPIHPVAAGITGAIVGAGFAVGVTVALKDEKARRHVKHLVQTVTGHMKDSIDAVKSRVDEKKGNIEGQLKKEQKELHKDVESVQKISHHLDK